MEVSTLEHWLNTLMQHDFKGREYVLSQLSHLEVVSAYDEDYISIVFRVTGGKSFPYNSRVPTSMFFYQTDGSPMDMLLHIVDGWVHELEIYGADGSAPNIHLFSFERVQYNIDTTY